MPTRHRATNSASCEPKQIFGYVAQLPIYRFAVIDIAGKDRMRSASFHLHSMVGLGLSAYSFVIE